MCQVREKAESGWDRHFWPGPQQECDCQSLRRGRLQGELLRGREVVSVVQTEIHFHEV